MMMRASRASDRSFRLSSSAPPVMESVATRVRKGTDKPMNSPQRFCSAPPCFAQNAWIAALSYTKGRPSSSTATGPPFASAAAFPLATYDLAMSSGASTPRMRTALETSAAAAAALPATSPTLATSSTPPMRARVVTARRTRRDDGRRARRAATSTRRAGEDAPRGEARARTAARGPATTPGVIAADVDILACVCFCREPTSNAAGRRRGDDVRRPPIARKKPKYVALGASSWRRKRRSSAESAVCS